MINKLIKQLPQSNLSAPSRISRFTVPNMGIVHDPAAATGRRDTSIGNNISRPSISFTYRNPPKLIINHGDPPSGVLTKLQARHRKKARLLSNISETKNKDSMELKQAVPKPQKPANSSSMRLSDSHYILKARRNMSPDLQYEPNRHMNPSDTSLAQKMDEYTLFNLRSRQAAEVNPEQHCKPDNQIVLLVNELKRTKEQLSTRQQQILRLANEINDLRKMMQLREEVISELTQEIVANQASHQLEIREKQIEIKRLANLDQMNKMRGREQENKLKRLHTKSTSKGKQMIKLKQLLTVLNSVLQ